MISRRAILGTLFGFPFGVKVAQATEIGDITITGIPGFDDQRIEDIGDAFLLSMENFMEHKGIRYTKTIDGNWPATWGITFLLTSSEYANKSILTMQRNWCTSTVARLVQELKEHHDSKCRHYGVEIFRYKGGLFVQMGFSQNENNPTTKTAVEAVYSKWLRAM